MIRLITERGQVTDTNFASIRKKKKIKLHVIEHIHMLLYGGIKKKASYLANSFRLNITFLNYVTYVVISIQNNYTQKSVTSGNIQNTKD